jgi:hypothetical protein
MIRSRIAEASIAPILACLCKVRRAPAAAKTRGA